MSNPFEDLRQAVVVRPMNSPGPQGAAGPELKIQYSPDGQSWHDDPLQTDRYLRFSTDNGVSWSDAIYFNNLSETLEWVEKARQWAENPENVEVEPGKYSSLHWADKAEQWAENPENVEVEPGKYSALHHATKAAMSEMNAEAAALDAARSAAEAFGAAAPAWDSLAVYNFPDVVAFTNGHTYRCIGTNVTSAPNVGGNDNEIDWTRITFEEESFFEEDVNGDFMPLISPSYSDYWMLDVDGSIMPDTIDAIQDETSASSEKSAGNESTLKTLIEDSSGTLTTITVYNGITITSDLNIPSNIQLQFKDNGMLSPEAGVTLTVNCGIDAGLWQIFGGEGTIDGSPEVDIIYPEWFGAVSNGITDCGPAIRKSIAISEGKTVMFTAGTYLITSLRGEFYGPGDFVAVLPSNITLDGNSRKGILKIGDNIGANAVGNLGGSLFYAADKENIVVRNIYFDLNGEKNLSPPDENTTYRGYALCLARCKNVLIEDCIFKDCFGHNVIVLGGAGIYDELRGDSAKIRNNIIINGGTSIPNNIYQNDFSAIYCEYSNSEICGNIIKHDNFPLTWCGGIEVHGPNIHVHHNYVEKSCPAVYLCSDVTGMTNENMYVTDNVFDNCHTGVDIFVHNRKKNIIIARNTIKLWKNENINTYSNGIVGEYPYTWGTDYTDITLLTTNIKIIDNIIEGMHGEPTSGMRLGPMMEAIISGNIIKNVTSMGISIMASYEDSQNIDISNNMIHNFGLNNAYQGDSCGILINAEGTATAPTVKNGFVLKWVRLFGNVISRTTDNANIAALYFTWNNDAIVSVTASQNEIRNISVLKAGSKAAEVTLT